MENDHIVLKFLTLGFLVFANAFFVAAEFALVRVRRTRIEELIGEGNRTARVVRNAIDHLDDYISATQVGITLASLALGWLGEPFLAALLEPLFAAVLPSGVAAGTAHVVGIGLAFFMITFLHVVLGELMPKSLALQFPEKISLYIARPMRFCTILFWPLIRLLNGSSNRLLRLFGVKPAEAHALALSEEEILMLLSESKNAGVVSEDEQKMLQRVFKFHDKTVREIMKPRPDIAALELRADEKEIKAVFEQGYSRLPVYDGTLNNVKGIVYVKDLIYTLQDPKLIKLIDLLREALFVPESKEVSALLREFQKSKVHMAIVVDEFGDTAGLVTLEDVIEEIVGEIQDEYDYEPAEVQRTRDGAVIFDGKTDLDRFKEIFPGFEMPEGSFETIAGLVFQLAGRVPRETDVMRHGDLHFTVVKREGRRLKKIAVRRETAAESADTHRADAALLGQTGAGTASGVESDPPADEPKPQVDISTLPVADEHGEPSTQSPKELPGDRRVGRGSAGTRR